MFSGIPVFALMALIAGSDAQIACAVPEHKIAPAALKLGIYSNTEADARKFAQTFYDWYIPDMTSNVPVPSSERMLTQRAGLIDPVLRGLLKDRIDEPSSLREHAFAKSWAQRSCPARPAQGRSFGSTGNSR